jgi:DNA mismatch repair protein MutS
MACSILFDPSEANVAIESRGQPEFFRDLNLDRIVAAATAGREEYGLERLYHSPPGSLQTIRYRQEIFRDFERPAVFNCVSSFCAHMRAVRAALAETRKRSYELQRQRWQLDTVAQYCEAVNALTHGLSAAELGSPGMIETRRHLQEYARSAQFTTLVGETEKRSADLAGIAYTVRIRGKRVEVGRYAGEADYAAQVLEFFSKFRQAAVTPAKFTYRSSADMNNIEAAILERVARLFPEAFAALAQYCERHRDFLDADVIDFDRGAQFYLGWLECLAPVRKAGLCVCYPEISSEPGGVFAREAFDLALALQRIPEKSAIVVNDFELREAERILVVSGPNQGGKTTFARMIGQMHHLARLGCPLPGRQARLLMADAIFTHFEREERVQTLTGKLEESLERMRQILERATSRSLLVMNESFDAATASDGLFLSREVLVRVARREMLCVCVTFLDELASLSEKTVSYVANVDPDEPTTRTFKVVRRAAEGLAYAMAVATKHGLTYACVKERILP